MRKQSGSEAYGRAAKSEKAAKMRERRQSSMCRSCAHGEMLASESTAAERRYRHAADETSRPHKFVAYAWVPFQ